MFASMRIFALLLLILASSCSSAKKREPLTPEQLQADRETFYSEVARDHAENARTFLYRIGSKARANPGADVTIDLLAISGGGSNGAFGTGFLRGWGEIEQGPFIRPEFDLLTGISTGALIAPFAFTGRYEQIDEIYRNPADDWAVKRSGALIGGGTSLLKPDKLWDQMRGLVSGDLLADIAKGRREHRMMLIGTIDADLGMQRVWNGAELAIAAQESGDASRLHDVIIASASYPGAFPAVEIDGHLHVDGGMGSLFVAGIDATWLQRAATAWTLVMGKEQKPPNVRIWVIVNNRLQVPPTTLQPTWLSTMGRGMDVGSRISSQILITAFINGAARASARTGWELEVRYVAIPDRIQLPESKSAFDKNFMRKLSDVGRAMGKDPASWQTSIPESEWPRDVELQPATDGEAPSK
jgi:hypothetical protein